MTENNSNFVDIKKDYYSYPTQVRWGEMDDGEINEYFGIAYKDKVICGCCGYTADLNDEDIYIFEKFDWIDISGAIEGQ